jgi:hypothetical protein
MQAELKFNLDEPDDVQAHLRCVKALDMALCLWDFSNFLRTHNKYTKDNLLDVETVQTELNDLLEKYDLNFDRLIS